MNTVKVGMGKRVSVKVITSAKKEDVLSESEREMDARAEQAVKAAVEKAGFCKKPVAKYDIKTKKVYMEYSDGERKYVE